MGEPSHPDTPATPTEWQQGTPFERAAVLIDKYEFVPAPGGATAWACLYRDLRASAERYRDIGIMDFAGRLESQANRARGAVQRHHVHGPPLPTTLRHSRDLLQELLA